MHHRISIIIPTYNEEHYLADALRSACALSRDVIVVDGGSQDDTAGVASRFRIKWICSPKGRACQMNKGAQVADGDILVFLHADTVLPDKCRTDIAQILESHFVGGRFRLSFSPRTRCLDFFALWSRLS